MSLIEDEMIAYLKKQFLDEVSNNLKFIRENQKHTIINDIKNNFLDKLEYLQKHDHIEINQAVIDKLIREYGDPKNIAQEYAEVYANRDIYIFSPIIQCVIGIVFITLGFYTYIFQVTYGDFYTFLLLPAIISTFLLVQGLISYKFGKTIQDKRIIFVLIIIFVILELFVIFFVIDLSDYNLIEIITSITLFILLIIIFITITYLQWISKSI